jgi:ferredoxin
VPTSPKTPLIIRRVWIEKAECTGHTLCVPEAPDLLQYLDSEDVTTVRQDQLRHTIAELTALISAAEVCPMHAFFIETEDGRVYNIPDDQEVRDAIRLKNYRWSTSVSGPRDIAPVA